MVTMNNKEMKQEQSVTHIGLKKMKDFWVENISLKHKTENPKSCKYILCSWNGRNNMKIAMSPK